MGIPKGVLLIMLTVPFLQRGGEACPGRRAGNSARRADAVGSGEAAATATGSGARAAAGAETAGAAAGAETAGAAADVKGVHGSRHKSLGEMILGGGARALANVVAEATRGNNANNASDANNATGGGGGGRGAREAAAAVMAGAAGSEAEAAAAVEEAAAFGAPQSILGMSGWPYFDYGDRWWTRKLVDGAVIDSAAVGGEGEGAGSSRGARESGTGLELEGEAAGASDKQAEKNPSDLLNAAGKVLASSYTRLGSGREKEHGAAETADVGRHAMRHGVAPGEKKGGGSGGRHASRHEASDRSAAGGQKANDQKGAVLKALGESQAGNKDKSKELTKVKEEGLSHMRSARMGPENSVEDQIEDNYKTKQGRERFVPFGIYVAYKLMNVNGDQAVHAERLIAHTLFEADTGSLNRNWKVVDPEGKVSVHGPGIPRSMREDPQIPLQ